MSADSCIAILVTKDRHKKEGRWPVRKDFVAYRVSYLSELETFNSIKYNEPWNIGAYLVEVWGRAKAYEDKELAPVLANKEDLFHRTKNGIIILDTEYSFYVR